MPKFSRASASQLATAHPLLRRLFERVVLTYDCTVIEGYRGQQAQDRAYAAGNSKLKFPHGKHNKYPSIAVDVAPYDLAKQGVNWDTNTRTNLVRFYHFGGYVKGIAELMAIPIRWGGDWDGDTYFNDQTFNDLVHFELTGPAAQ